MNQTTLGWIYLIISILLEVAATTCMKLSYGFTVRLPSIMMIVFYCLCFIFSTIALKTINVSVAYAVWAGLGTLFITTVGIIWLKEPVTLIKFISIGLVMVGVIGLKSGY